MAELLLEAQGLHSFYGVSHILHGVDFSVARGECIGLMGRNGMGKTTLLKSMLGLVRPKEGSVRVRGRDSIDGRPRGFLSQFGVSRVRFRDMAHRGELPGITKSSW